MSTMSNLSFEDNRAIQERIIERGGVGLILRVMGKCAGNAGVLSIGLDCLGNLLPCSLFLQNLRDEKAEKLLIKILGAIQDEDVQVKVIKSIILFNKD